MSAVTKVNIVHNIDANDINDWIVFSEDVDGWFVNAHSDPDARIPDNEQGVCLSFMHQGISFEMVLTKDHILWLNEELAHGTSREWP